jgi:hypothetical protein
VPTGAELRRGALAVSVLNDVDLEPNRQGVRLTGARTVFVSWNECRRALAGHDPESDLGRIRLAGWLQARRWAADRSLPELRERLRPVGLPLDHVLHLGLEWVRRRVLGDALDLGLGAVDLDPRDPERVVMLPQPVLDAAGLDGSPCWAESSEYLERMGQIAADSLQRHGKGQLRPIGDCDVVTLLGSQSLRSAIAADSNGLGAVVAPMLRRGWSKLSLVDPAFAPVAWTITDAKERGFPRPLLITRDEVVLALDGGAGTDLLLRDPAPRGAWVRDVLHR